MEPGLSGSILVLLAFVAMRSLAFFCRFLSFASVCNLMLWYDWYEHEISAKIRNVISAVHFECAVLTFRII